jgi:hypothetical protein
MPPWSAHLRPHNAVREPSAGPGESVLVHLHRLEVSSLALAVLLILAMGMGVLLLGPDPALAAESCPPSMAPIPGGRYRIGAAGRLPEEAE